MGIVEAFPPSDAVLDGSSPGSSNTPEIGRRMLLFVCACLLPAFWVSFAAVGAMRWIAPRLGLIDKPAARKVHLTPKPMGGGIGIWCGVLIPLAAALLLVLFFPNSLPVPIPGKTVSAEGSVLYKLPQLLAVTLGALAMGLVGLADDFKPLPWQPRLFLQFFIASVVVACGVRATLFIENAWIGAIASVLWFVVLVNSINFLDNMDGLSGGICLIVSGVFACMMLSRTDDPRWMVGGFFLLLCGSLLGFLCHNWSPARIFMGDAGSYFLGFAIASMTILGTFYSESDGRTHVILAPLCVLAVPFYDLLSVISIRLREGRSPFQPDKKHFSHRLVALGLKPVHAVLTVHLATLTTGLAGLLLCSVPTLNAAFLALGVVVCILAMIAILESAPRPILPLGPTGHLAERLPHVAAHGLIHPPIPAAESMPVATTSQSGLPRSDSPVVANLVNGAEASLAKFDIAAKGT
jgi:UDP-GlcNAc:undecaprenyl-phosphate GlcNAc-1-phosphate transferase